MTDTQHRDGLTFPGLAWCLLHAPLYLLFFATSISEAVELAPEAYRAAIWPIFLPEALLLALVAFAVSLPLAPFPRAYRHAAPALAGIFTVGILLDARVYEATRFHLNGFFLRVVWQPNVLAEVGVPPRAVAAFLLTGAAVVAVELVAGSWFLRRFARPGAPWRVAVPLLLLGAAERVYGAVVTEFAGPSVAEASATLPLQVPLRMRGIVRRLVTVPRDPLGDVRASSRLPPALPPDEVHLAHTPDVVVGLAESLPAAHFDERTMPRLWARAAAGARFDLHIASAVETNHATFSIVYGLQAQKLPATVGAGRAPLLFAALARNGYQVHVLAASCVDWMDLRTTVFVGVPLETWCNDPPTRDARLLARAREIVAAADPGRPLFLFVFLFGTHFNYFHADEDRIYLPEWDGQADFRATKASPAEIRNRARNAAHALDRAFDGLLGEVATRRGRAPLVFFTADHGQEFREKGHLGHGSEVTREQIHVPAFLAGPGVAPGVFGAPTSHADIVPTLLTLLGDAHPPSRWSDGISMLDAEQHPGRFVLSTVGWEPRHAAVGRDLKVRFFVGGSEITDLDDRPLPDGPVRAARHTAEIVKALRGAADEPAAVAHAPGG